MVAKGRDFAAAQDKVNESIRAGFNIGNIQARLDGGAAQSGSTEFLTLCCPIENCLLDIYLKNRNSPYLQFSSHGA